MIAPRMLLFALLALAPASAFANDYVSTNPNDWFRYANQQTQQQVRSEVDRDLTSGQGDEGWRLWSNWAGLGHTWMYTSPNHDYLWLWNGTTHTLVGNLDGAVGEEQTVNLDCNTGPARIASRGPLTTAAGAFNDVTKIAFTTSCSDAGTTAIWFAKGVGIVKWTEQSIMGEQTFELTSALVDGRSYPQTAPTPTAPATGVTVAPREDATMETILWGANDTYLVLPTYRDSFRALDGTGLTSTVIVSAQWVASELRYELAQDNVPMDDVVMYVAALDSVWIRDYGPIVLKRPDGTRVVADPDYYPGRPQDNGFPRAWADFNGWDYVKVDVGFEGGNFACDGAGMQISSFGVQWFNPNMSVSSIEREFAKFGSNRLVWLEPLIDEGTTHVDMFMRIMDEDNALVSRYPANHRQAAIVDACATRMQQEGYRVTRVDVDYAYDEFATYSNSVLVNGIALVPMYTDAAKNARALQAYRDLGFTAVPVDGTRIIKYSGATHCVSMQVPAGN